MAIIKVIVSGPVGCGKSAIIQEIVGAMRAIGLPAEAPKETSYDTGGDPVAHLDTYREGLRVEVYEQVVTQQSVEMLVGGGYQMPDGRQFWIDAPVAREIARRALGLTPSWNEQRKEP